MIQVWLYDARGVLLDTTSIEDTDSFPRNSTQTPPPPAKDGFSIVHAGHGWSYVAVGQEPDPTPAPIRVMVPQPLTPLQFLTHVQKVGGFTDAGLVAAKADAVLGPLWSKLVDFQGSLLIHKEATLTIGGLTAMRARHMGGDNGQPTYIPDDAHYQAVLDNWPMMPAP